MAEVILPVAAVVAAGTGGYSAYSSDVSQRKGLARQKTAQQLAQNSALKQEKTAEEEVMRARRKQPDLAAILADMQGLKPTTKLTGPGGLASTSLLGG